MEVVEAEVEMKMMEVEMKMEGMDVYVIHYFQTCLLGLLFVKKLHMEFVCPNIMGVEVYEPLISSLSIVRRC